MSERRRRRKEYFQIPSTIFKGSTAKFWDGLKDNKFLTTKCKDCSELFFPPRALCPECLSMNLEWVELSGEGKLYSWSYVNDYKLRYFSRPYVIGIVELKEGIGRIITKIDAKKDELKIGMPVKLKFIKYELKGKEYPMLYAELA